MHRNSGRKPKIEAEVTAEFKEDLEQVAKRHGQQLAPYVRFVLHEHLNAEKAKAA